VEKLVHRWKEITKVDLKGTWCEAGDRIYLLDYYEN
jgi:hypothetical protein